VQKRGAVGLLPSTSFTANKQFLSGAAIGPRRCKSAFGLASKKEVVAASRLVTIPLDVSINKEQISAFKVAVCENVADSHVAIISGTGLAAALTFFSQHHPLRCALERGEAFADAEPSVTGLKRALVSGIAVARTLPSVSEAQT
jgi:hypothetical protein